MAIKILFVIPYFNFQWIYNKLRRVGYNSAIYIKFYIMYTWL